jgi:hypothetical protein
MANIYAKTRKMQVAGGAPVDPMATGGPLTQDDILAVAKSRLGANLPMSLGLSKGDSVSTSEAGPAPTADIMRLLDIAGIKNDGSKIDMSPYMSKRAPDLQALKDFSASRPTEVSLRGLDQIANALSSTDRKVKFENPGHTADESLSDWASLGDKIQEQKDNDLKKQQEMFKLISGVTKQSGASSSKTSEGVNYTVPQPHAGGGGGLNSGKLADLAEKYSKRLENLSGFRSALEDMESITNKDGSGGILTNPNAKMVSAGKVSSGVPTSMIGPGEMIGMFPKGSAEERKAAERLIIQYQKAVAGLRGTDQLREAERQALGFITSGDPSLVQKGIRSLSRSVKESQNTVSAGYPQQVKDFVHANLGYNPAEFYGKIANEAPASSGAAPAMDQAAMARKILESRKAKK